MTPSIALRGGVGYETIDTDPHHRKVSDSQVSATVHSAFNVLTLSHKVAELYGGRKTTCPLHIVIIGCGLGGLAAAHTLTQAGHRVTILEQASAISEVGAGMQVTPNMSRLLFRWGLGAHLTHLAVVPEAVCFRRCTEAICLKLWIYF